MVIAIMGLGFWVQGLVGFSVRGYLEGQGDLVSWFIVGITGVTITIWVGGVPQQPLSLEGS